jgi:hypothetical protein
MGGCWARLPKVRGTWWAAVVMGTRRWEDYVTLGLTEIRQFGAAAVQIMRTLRALLEELLDTVLPEHRSAIEEELRRLDATVGQSWGDSVDFDRASTADRQGMAARSPARTATRARKQQLLMVPVRRQAHAKRLAPTVWQVPPWGQRRAATCG